MPDCLNYGAQVTQRYVRVFAPDGFDSVRVCPWCEDKIRDGATVRDSKSTRRPPRPERDDNGRFVREQGASD